VEAYQRDDYAVAVDKLERAYQILKAPSIGLWLGRALAKSGRLVEASERYTEVGRLQLSGGDTTVQESAKREAASELEALTPKIPTLVVRLEGAEPSEVTLELDGKALPAAVVGEQQPVNPGKHQLKGRRGTEETHAEASVKVGENKTVTLRFQAGAPIAAASAATAAAPNDGQPSDKRAASTSSTRKVLAWSAIGVGAAGIVTGAITGSMAIAKKGELDDSPDCKNGQCLTSTMQDELDSYSTLRTVSSVGFIAGGVLAATGVVLLATSPRAETQTAERGWWLRVGPGSVVARGRF
jgi:hypothetical protein